MFATPELLFKNGELIVRDGKIVKVVQRRHARRAPVLRPRHREAAEGLLRRLPHRAHGELPPLPTMRSSTAAAARSSCNRPGRGRHEASTASPIDDTFAEAFGMSGDRHHHHRRHAEVGAPGGDRRDRLRHLRHRLRCEGGIDRELTPDETPDGRPGVRVLMFGFSPDALGAADQEPRRPMRADEPGLGLLRRARRRRSRSASAKARAFSATASRPRRSSATAATGAFP